MATRKTTKKSGGNSPDIEGREQVALPTEATVPLGKKFEAKKWKLDLVTIWCSVAEPLDVDDNVLFCFRVNFTPREIAEILEQSPPSAYALSFELQLPASQPDGLVQVTNIGLVAEETVLGVDDQSRVGQYVKEGADIGGTTMTALGALAATVEPTLALLGIGLGTLIKAAGYGSTRFFRKQAISTGVPFILGERTFGWRFTETDSGPTPSGLIEGAARLRMDTPLADLEVRVSVSLRDGNEIATEFKTVPISYLKEPKVGQSV